MDINAMLASRGMTKYRLSKLSGVSQTTVIDICSGKVSLDKCAAGTLFKLAKTLGVDMESLLERRPDFEAFKSHVCHRVKELGDCDFIIQTLKSDAIGKYQQKGWHLESLYLLAMVDYLCRENGLPMCMNYNSLRCMRLSETVFPAGINILCIALGSNESKQEGINASIPEFIRHNIVEAEIRDVC